MTQHRRTPDAPRPATPRKRWLQPTVTTLEAGAAELAGGGADDGVDLS